MLITGSRPGNNDNGFVYVFGEKRRNPFQDSGADFISMGTLLSICTVLVSIYGVNMYGKRADHEGFEHLNRTALGRSAVLRKKL